MLLNVKPNIQEQRLEQDQIYEPLKNGETSKVVSLNRVT